MNPRRIRPLLAPVLCMLAGTVPAADLKFDGRVIVKKLMGDSVQITVTAASGTAGLPVVLFLDVLPGPIPSPFGGTLPLGFSPLTVTLLLGVTGAGGTLTTTVALPHDPGANDLTLYGMAVVVDQAAPSGLDISNGASLTLLDRNIELAGNALSQYPFFDAVRSINQGSSVELGIDPTRYPGIVGMTADVYVVASKSRAGWIGDPSLTDVAGGPQAVTFAGSTIQANTIILDGGSLAGPDATPGAGDTDLGVPYDVVIDLDQDGVFDPGSDLIDGYHARYAGFYVVRDTTAGSIQTTAATITTPGAGSGGPYAVTEILYTGGTWLGQDTYYPSNVASMGQLPLIVVSHGNGHNYQWYDHVGYHMASYGYIVMSHENQTGPGSGIAALTTLNNTEYLLANQGAIGGGVLNGHIDSSKIVWIGHSRGADGVARAYDDLFNGVAVGVTQYSIGDILLVDSIAPVDFGGWAGKQPILGGTSGSHPHNANFHLWVGQADADVSGCASSNQLHWYHLHDRATNRRQSTSLYGVGHGDFHDGGGSSVAAGNEQIGRPVTHLIVKGYLLPLVKYFVEDDAAARDFLWRQYDSFRPIGVPVTTPIVAGPPATIGMPTNVTVNLMFQDEKESGKFIIDDFQDNLVAGVVTPTPTVASSGASVTRTTPQYLEGSMDDRDNSFVWAVKPPDPWNGFINDGDGGTGPFRSESFGCVFNVDSKGSYHITYDVDGVQSNFCDFAYLSFRAAQGTRHPFTYFELADVTFTVTLEDAAGVQSSINIGAYGGGIEEPYQRRFCGVGFGSLPSRYGWNSEFETIRIRLTDFENNGSGLNLSEVSKLIFNFGGAFGSSRARLGLDEIELTAR